MYYRSLLSPLQIDDQKYLCSYSFLPLFIDKDDDIVDEAIRLFRANVLFRNFEVQGGGDRILVYLTLFIHQVRRTTFAKKLRGGLVQNYGKNDRLIIIRRIFTQSDGYFIPF